MKYFATATILGLAHGIMLQEEIDNWVKHQGMCLDMNDYQYDGWEYLSVSAGWGEGGKISVNQCVQDCMATPSCVGITYSTSAGRCGLRTDDGTQVNLPDYETYSTATDGYIGVGPVGSGAPQGDWMCAVNPYYQGSSSGAQWEYLEGMCIDASGNQYDDWEEFGVTNGWGNGGKNISIEECYQDCESTDHCVGINYSNGAGRCVLRVEDGAEVYLPDYEPTQVGYTGVGAVASAAPQGDWQCYVNPDFVSQSSGGSDDQWYGLEGMCVDANGNQYDDWEEFGVTNGWGNGGKDISMNECYEDCAATAQCVGINYSNGAGRCVLRVTDGASVDLPDYEPTQVGYTGVGPVGDAMPQGDWMCYINPDFVDQSPPSGDTGAQWDQLEGMCIDASGNQYDDWEEFGVTNGWGNGGAGISIEECYQDCEMTAQCVGINYSNGAGRCVLRVEDGATVDLPDYEATQVGYTGVGTVASAAPQGDWQCYVNPDFVAASSDNNQATDSQSNPSDNTNTQSGDNSQSGSNGSQDGNNHSDTHQNTDHSGHDNNSGNNHSGDMTIYDDGSHTHDEPEAHTPTQQSSRGAPLVEVNVYG